MKMARRDAAIEGEKMAIKKALFGTAPSGEEVYIYSLENKNGMRADIMTYGANLVNLIVPNNKGELADINLGYDELAPYTKNTDNFGAVMGPNCNRIGNAVFYIDGQKIELPKNDGENNLHSDAYLGTSKKVWKVISCDAMLVMETSFDDGDISFPGNRIIRVTYTLTDANELKLHYEATSDKKTLFNLTNHAYFNLDGHGSGLIHDHELVVKASHFTPVVKGGIPTGEIAPVSGTAFDFTTKRKLGEALSMDDDQLKGSGGIDHNFVIDDYDGSLKCVAELSSEASGRKMKVYTNLPGIQIYAGNFIGDQIAKDGAHYNKRMGIAMETQFFPDTPNHDNFPTAFFGPDRVYDYTTVYAFE